MEKLLCITLLCFLPLGLVADDAKGNEPRKATIHSWRIVPKEGQENALKVEMAGRVKKLSTGNWKWRVYEVLTGPETGAYMIVEGPNSWTAFEEGGDRGSDRLKDFRDKIQPFVKNILPEIYATYVADASTAAADYSSKKILISNGYFKPGRAERAHDDMKAWKKVYEKLGLDVVMWRTFFSGEERYIFAGSLKAGFKDLDDPRIDFRKAADEVLGVGALDRLAESDSANYARIVTEIIEFRPELSSK